MIKTIGYIFGFYVGEVLASFIGAIPVYIFYNNYLASTFNLPVFKYGFFVWGLLALAMIAKQFRPPREINID